MTIVEAKKNLAFRLATLFWLAGWFFKIPFLIPFLGKICFEVPLNHPLFPSFFENPLVSWGAYLLPIFGFLAVIVPRFKKVRVLVGFLFVICSALLTFHINTYNDATFVTSFWAGLWILWYAVSFEAPADILQKQEAFLAKGVVSLVFLGGFVGKLTGEYWSGEILYHIYFLQKENFFYPGLREHLSPDQLQLTALYFSRLVVIMEGVMSVGFLFPSRFSFIFSIFIMTGIVLGSVLQLFSVMGCLIGLCLAGLVLSRISALSINPDIITL